MPQGWVFAHGELQELMGILKLRREGRLTGIEAPPLLAKHRIGPGGIPVGAGNTAQAGEKRTAKGCAVFCDALTASEQAHAVVHNKKTRIFMRVFHACSVTPTGFKPVTF